MKPSPKITRRKMLQFIPSVGLAASPIAIAAATNAHMADVDLTLTVSEVDGLPHYNGKPLGPTIIANPGETIDVKLINNLPPLHDDCTHDPNNFHGLNTTNLHTHGLHVSPTTDSTGIHDADNVFWRVREM